MSRALSLSIDFLLSICLLFSLDAFSIRKCGSMLRHKSSTVWVSDSAVCIRDDIVNLFSITGLIAFSSYNPIKNNVKRDVIVLSIANIVTSLYTALVVFCVLGFMGHNNYIACIERYILHLEDDLSFNTLFRLYNLHSVKFNVYIFSVIWTNC